ncbi:MAG TPA: hypothetical protein VKO67_09745 [Smithellaceae bacterium]|nr:hypothetical protein [Smithellaceae bacterium]
MIKKYQPGRPDLLINTDWGVPRDVLSEQDAQHKGLRLFHGRWMTKTEKKQLEDERGAYVSIRILGCILLLIAVPVLLNIRLIAEGGVLAVALAIFYALFAAVTGFGLIRFARYARYPAVGIFLSFFILPFVPFMESEKGAPLLFVLGAAGLYYLLRKTARQIFWPASKGRPDTRKIKPRVRYILYGGVLIAGFSAGYFIYDLSQAKHLAASACREAKQGMSPGDYMSRFSASDYRIIQSADHITVVPKRGFGRNHCIVIHDGQKITGSQTGFAD